MSLINKMLAEYIENGIAYTEKYLEDGSLFSTAIPSGVNYTEIVTEDGGVSLEVELPGLDKKDIEVIPDESTITVLANRSTPKDVVFTSSQYGEIKKVFKLPSTLDSGSTEAKYENGILYITIKKQKKNTNKVEVK